jgi:UDP-N-acetylmuramyl pentapeptide phosphotransferase/UDP-N-acetylglucosamine-1-phosphate transferase
LNNAFALVMAGTLVVTGFVNAGNMADGANGLLGTVAVSFLSVFMVFNGSSFASMFIMALLIFLTFNVATGRIFLGDFGAYGLSAIIAFGSLKLYASGSVSSWFFGSLLAYPCIEMARVIVVRVARGASPFQSSNDHLHNYLYKLLRKWGWNRLVANSTTGCFLGAVSALLPAFLVLLGVFDPGNTLFWGCYFAVYLVLHLSFVLQLERALNEK